MDGHYLPTCLLPVKECAPVLAAVRSFVDM